MGQITQAEDVDDSAHGRREHGGQFERPSAAFDKEGPSPVPLPRSMFAVHVYCESCSIRVKFAQFVLLQTTSWRA